MATPHVAGSGALVKQLHPNWSPRQIKAALMGTARWRGVMDSFGQHAQPLGMLQIAHARTRVPALTRARNLHSPVSNTHADMGAGVVDLTKIADPGALLDPPSLSFGYTLKGDSQQITVTVANVAATPQNFTISSSLADSSSPVPGCVHRHSSPMTRVSYS
jgi:subtilisin family serine protease